MRIFAAVNNDSNLSRRAAVIAQHTKFVTDKTKKTEDKDMIETFCILMMVFCIILFIVKGIGHAGKALCATPKPSSKKSCPESNKGDLIQEISFEPPVKIIEEKLRRKEKERKLREERYWEEFPEKYKGAVCDEEMKAILDLARKENKTKEEELILLFAKLQVEDLYRKKNATAN